MVKNLIWRNLLAISVIAGGYAFLGYSAVSNPDHSYTLCMFKNVTGHPCPGCGMGRASIELFKGNLGESFHYHWWAIPFHVLMLVSLVWLLRDMLKNSDSFWKFIQKPMKSWWLALIFVLVLINWGRALYLNI